MGGSSGMEGDDWKGDGEGHEEHLTGFRTVQLLGRSLCGAYLVLVRAFTQRK